MPPEDGQEHQRDSEFEANKKSVAWQVTTSYEVEVVWEKIHGGKKMFSHLCTKRQPFSLFFQALPVGGGRWIHGNIRLLPSLSRVPSAKTSISLVITGSRGCVFPYPRNIFLCMKGMLLAIAVGTHNFLYV